MNRVAKQLTEWARDSIPQPDRRSTLEWAEQEGFALPGSLRSSRFRIDIAP